MESAESHVSRTVWNCLGHCASLFARLAFHSWAFKVVKACLATTKRDDVLTLCFGLCIVFLTSCREQVLSTAQYGRNKHKHLFGMEHSQWCNII